MKLKCGDNVLPITAERNECYENVFLEFDNVASTDFVFQLEAKEGTYNCMRLCTFPGKKEIYFSFFHLLFFFVHNVFYKHG